MKKLLVLFILLTIFLSGCGIFNLNGWIVPDDGEFLAVIEELDTPEKICQYMTDNFESEEHPYITLTPYQLYITRKGDCNDFSNFSVFIANYHGYETYQILIYYKNNNYKHMLAVYKENKYSFSDCEIYCSARYNTFSEIVEYDCYLRDEIWSKYIVYDYWNDIILQVTK